MEIFCKINFYLWQAELYGELVVLLILGYNIHKSFQAERRAMWQRWSQIYVALSIALYFEIIKHFYSSLIIREAYRLIGLGFALVACVLIVRAIKIHRSEKREAAEKGVSQDDK